MLHLIYNERLCLGRQSTLNWAPKMFLLGRKTNMAHLGYFPSHSFFVFKKLGNFDQIGYILWLNQQHLGHQQGLVPFMSWLFQALQLSSCQPLVMVGVKFLFIFIPLCQVASAKKLERTNNVRRSCSTFSLNYHDLRRCHICGVESWNDKMAMLFLLKVVLVVSPVSLEQKTCIRRWNKSSSFLFFLGSGHFLSTDWKSKEMMFNHRYCSRKQQLWRVDKDNMRSWVN